MRLKLVVFLAALTAAGYGMQDAFSRLELTRANVEASVTAYLQKELGEDRFAIPGMGAKQKILLKGMDDATRAAVVKEVALAMKAFVMSPAFQTGYVAYLKTNRNAVDHGLKISDTEAEMKAATEKMMKGGDASAMQSSMEKMMREQLRATVVGMLPQIPSWGKDELNAIGEGMESQLETIPPKNATEKAQQTKGIALIKEALALSSTNLGAAREKIKQGLLLGVYAGEGNADAAKADEAKREQQKNFNKLAFRPALKKQLLALSNEIKSVDFKATLVAKGPKQVFANPVYEKKNYVWKLIYRMGPATSQVIGQIAASWAAEL